MRAAANCVPRFPHSAGEVNPRKAGRHGPTRRELAALGSLWPFGGAAARAADSVALPKSPSGPTGEVVSTVAGIRQKRLGSGDVIVSELGLGTQRWGGADRNSPDEALCFRLLDRATEAGVSLIDTAEQYPIPSDRARPEGSTEAILGRWLAQDAGRRAKVMIASKITGGANVTPANILADCEGSLRRLRTDRLDVYLLHWPARYTPQANWGQSLEYHQDAEKYYRSVTSFEAIAQAMGSLVSAGKIRGWGICNDNCFGLTSSYYAARLTPGAVAPICMQNDYSLINRRCDENGLAEASSPLHLNTGFMAYNVLAGGMLTGKYLDVPAGVDDENEGRGAKNMRSPRGRMDEPGWGRTLYRYRTAAAERATRAYAALAASAGMSPTALALRWCRQRSLVTSSLVGFTSEAQLDEALRAFSNPRPLDDALMWEIDRVHMRNRLPIFSSERVGSDWAGAGEIGERIP
jgi:aryl-alcohol dehydrogenase-like predicted oxidoreductase